MNPDLKAIREHAERCTQLEDCPFGCGETVALLDYTEALIAALREAEGTIAAFAPKKWWREHPRRAEILALLPPEPQR